LTSPQRPGASSSASDSVRAMNKLRESLSGDELRFSPIHDNDHAGYIWIVAIMALIYSLAATITRIFIKISMFGTDDYLLVASMVNGLDLLDLGVHKLTLLLCRTLQVFHIAQSIAIFAGLGQGLGKFNSITTTEQWASAGKVSRHLAPSIAHHDSGSSHSLDRPTMQPISSFSWPCASRNVLSSA